ncbi:MAG: AMP-binding protein [Betaproteobacteria bacterium]|nr:MAG: AMP-binding protein [Betaproteobacteria bacterium]
MSTLVNLLENSARDYGGATALVMRAGLRDDRWSYERLWHAACAVGAYLREQRGLQPGDRVLLCAPNQPRLVATLLGAMLARLVPVPLDPFSAAEFAARVARDTESALFINGTSLEVPGVAQIALANLPVDATPPRMLERPTAGDIAEIVYTSGTTGRPKGVVLTHANIWANMLSADQLIPHSKRWRLLSLLPLSHMMEQTVGLFGQLYRGSTIVYGVAHHPAAVLKALRRYRIVAMVVVPQVLLHMLHALEHEVQRRGLTRLWQWQNRLAVHLPLSGRRLLWHRLLREMGGELDIFISGGAALPSELGLAWERLGIPVVQGYGATECAPVITGNTLARRVPDSVGRPVVGLELRLAENSEVQVRGASVFSGYWRNEEATRDAFTPDGWYRTGDIAATDAAGNLFIKGRLKNMVVLPSGLNVFLEDLEAICLEQTGVRNCVVIDTQGARGGTTFTAVVIGECDEDAMRSVNARLAEHQRLGAVVHWEGDDFPRTRLGKIKRAEVRSWLEQRDRRGTAPRADVVVVESQETKLARVLSEVSGVTAQHITGASNLNLDLALTSLSRVELALAIEESFGVVLDDGELAGIETVAQLASLLERGGSAEASYELPAWPVRAPARAARALLQVSLLFPAHALLARPFSIVDREKLAELELPALFIANHASHVDTVSILRALPRRIRRALAVAAAADYFYRFAVLGWLASLFLNTFSFSREGAVRASLEHCGELADDGWSLLIYPEGTRSPSGDLLPFKSGIALLATGLDVPVVPIAVLGGHGVLPKGRILPRPGPVRVVFGTPLRLRHGIELEAAVSQMRGAVAELMRMAASSAQRVP